MIYAKNVLFFYDEIQKNQILSLSENDTKLSLKRQFLWHISCHHSEGNISKFQ